MKYDFDCRLLESLDGTDASFAKTASALSAMKEDHGISCFFLSHPFDIAHGSVNEELLCLSHLKEKLREHLASDIRIKLFSAVVLQDGVSSDLHIPKLLRLCHGYLPLRLPLFPNTEMIDRELNALLYRRKISPLFLSFDRIISTYPTDFVQKLLRIQEAAFAFSHASFPEKKVYLIVKQLLSCETPILFGSKLRSPLRLSEIAYTDFCVSEEKYLSAAERKHIQDTARQFWSV